MSETTEDEGQKRQNDAARELLKTPEVQKRLAENDTTKLGPPRIFVEVIREVEGGGALRVQREIDLAVFSRARISMADLAINECLAEMSQYGKA